jgi:methenyltetrahydromethanopterin cyclohydrolase
LSDVETLSVNRRAAELTAALRRDAAMLNLGVTRGPRGETLIDAGAQRRGGVDAGLRIAEICLGGLGAVRLTPDSATPRWPWTIAVTS